MRPERDRAHQAASPQTPAGHVTRLQDIAPPAIAAGGLKDPPTGPGPWHAAFPDDEPVPASPM